MTTVWIILTTIACYFALLFIISWITGRKADNAGFFTGNRKSSWYMVTLAMIGATISGVTFISVPGAVLHGGYCYMQMVLGFFVGSIFVAFVLIPLFYRMNLMSIYGYLENRFGLASYRTGAWFFFVSKMLGASVRFFVVCVVLQSLVFTPLNVPFSLNVVITVALIWLYSFQGGVKSLIWTDSLKTICLVLSVVCCIVFIAGSLNLGIGDLPAAIGNHPTSRTFFFDDPNDGRYFWKQFIAGVFMVIATTGLDQDLMQRTLSCKNFKESQKNMILSSFIQIFVIIIFVVMFIGNMGQRVLPSTGNERKDLWIAVAVNTVMTAAALFILLFIQYGGSLIIGTGQTLIPQIDIYGTGQNTSCGSLDFAFGYCYMMGGTTGVVTYLYRKYGNIWVGVIPCAIFAGVVTLSSFTLVH